MVRYKCPACGEEQYSASEDKANEPCIFCGHCGTDLQENIGIMHYLKTWPEYYDAIRTGAKRFEIRKNDRAFKVGDILVLQEYDPESKSYTEADEMYFDVTYILEGAPFLPVGYACMSISRR